MTTAAKKIEKPRFAINPEKATEVAGWFVERGGIHIWTSVDLSRPGEQTITPATLSGSRTPTTKPHWMYGDTPEHVKWMDGIDVISDKEVKRFHIGVRLGNNGMSVKLTDGATRRVRAAVAKAEETYATARYAFDYERQEAVIFGATEIVSLETFIARQMLKELHTDVNEGPKIGQTVYVRGAMYISRGEDDRAGGLATVIESKYEPKINGGTWALRFKEIRGVGLYWDSLGPEQKKLAEEYGERIAHPDPDYHVYDDDDDNSGWRSY